MSELILRHGQADDLGAIHEIYDHYIRSSPATFDLEPMSMTARRNWFGAFSTQGPHQLHVALQNGELLGYAMSKAFRPKAAYDSSVETSIYLREGSEGKGIGEKLYSHLLEAVTGAGIHRALAGMTLPNPASVALHEKLGYEYVGTFTEVGFKFDRYWDVGWYEKHLP
jgi:phosphinothricin acetyltransferase